MPPISRPPSTNQRVAATSAQPASTQPTNGLHHIESVLSTLFKVTLTIFFFMHILLAVVCIHRLFILHASVPSNAAQPASPPLGDDTMEISSMDLGPFIHPVVFAYMGVAFFTIFLLILIFGLDLMISRSRPPDFHREYPFCTRRGLDPAVIKTFPIVIYSAIKMHKIGEASLECSVCLNCFKDDDKLCLIPKCDHAFHPDCIGKWLASHTTCPVCRANLALLPAVHSSTQLADSRTKPPQVEVKVESAPPDGGASERSPREGGSEQIQPPDLWDKNESGSFNDRNRARGFGRIRRFPRSHSTGHSLVQPSKDTERFTLRLSTMARKQLMDRPGPLPPLEGCPGQGYLCGGEGSSRGRYYLRYPDQLDRAAMSERLDFNRSSPTVVADGGGGSLEVRFNRLDRPFSV